MVHTSEFEQCSSLLGTCTTNWSSAVSRKSVRVTAVCIMMRLSSTWTGCFRGAEDVSRGPLSLLMITGPRALLGFQVLPAPVPMDLQKCTLDQMAMQISASPYGSTSHCLRSATQFHRQDHLQVFTPNTSVLTFSGCLNQCRLCCWERWWDFHYHYEHCWNIFGHSKARTVKIRS